MKKLLMPFVAVCLFQLFFSCKAGAPERQQLMPVVSVKVSPLARGDIEDQVSFNGTSVYLRKNMIVSPIAGYISKADVRYGEDVRNGQPLFEIQTRERKALQGDNESASDFGTIVVTASSDGFIDDLAVSESGVYVPEGSQLCSILNNKDLMVRVNVPFEYNKIVTAGRKCTIFLADSTVISGSVSRILPVVDAASQTQAVLIRPETERQLPENLNMIIKFISEEHRQTFLVSKSSLMTDETQSEFWIMRIVNDSIAVKVPVNRGIENDSMAEIFSPQLNVNDRVIYEGAYGLPDSTVIEIVR
jgi:multidrug efflux pump subunit AcrA (membrane-fusion protein)